MRVIQRRRKSRFLFLRSRYAYFHPRSTVSFAGRHNLLRAPKAPRAAFMICFLRLRRTTFDLTLGMGALLRLEETLEHARLAVRGHEGGAAQVPLPLRVLLGEDVTLVGLEAANLSLPGD